MNGIVLITHALTAPCHLSTINKTAVVANYGLSNDMINSTRLWCALAPQRLIFDIFVEAKAAQTTATATVLMG